MFRPIIYPYKIYSRSAKLLATELETKRVFPNKNYRPKENHLIINWGNSTYPNWRYNPFKMLNDPRRVASASNKLKSFKIFKERNILSPEFTENKLVASWWIDQGNKVICRTSLTGHSGQGIVIASTVDELVDARSERAHV